MPRPANAKPKKGVNKRKLMNSMVNIPSTNPDPYYRYKMPALDIRINPARIRTNNPQKEAIEVPASTQIQNLMAIAKALNRPLEYLSKIFELELEMQGVMEDRQRWFKLCGGELSEQELMIVLDKFIRRFVLCFICNNPETALTIFNTHIMKECGACGQSTRVDRFSKLTRYILRNKNFALGFAPVAVDATRCRFLKEGAATAAKGTVMNAAAGFKNGVRIATPAEMADGEDEEEEEDDADQDWLLDTSAEAVAQRRLKELDLITRVEKIMNAVVGDKARGKYPYKVFEEFVLTPKEVPGSDQEAVLPDNEEVLGRFYTLDLEKEGAILILERLQKRQQQQEDNTAEAQISELEQKSPVREDYDEMIQVLRDSLEREVVVASTLDESSSGLSSSDDEEDSEEEEEESD
ncbi:hypothetical protein BGZ79_003268 [Entomortierella chlamydospora]|nr:hypothetical protein BGZ79_003268 [Entomortierella chlamydospora]